MKSHREQQALRLATLFEDTVLLLVCALPLLVPFSLGRSIDLQGLVIILTGVVAWSAVVLRWRQIRAQNTKLILYLLGIYIASCVLSLAANISTSNILGAPLMRLAAPALIACVGCGLALQAIDTKRLIKWLYASISLAAITAIPYSYFVNHQALRLGGVFGQADILAVFMGCGLLLGVAMWRLYPKRQLYVASLQALMLVVLFWSQTRAVIILVLLMGLTLLWQSRFTQKRKILISIGMFALLACGSLIVSTTLSQRLNDQAYAVGSISYRLDLQQAGLRSTTNEPVFGYGAGSIENGLTCKSLNASSLQQTCSDGYYFTSSHNIYLDRILAIGWFGGLSYILLVAVCLYIGFSQHNKNIRILALCALLIALYYLTNVTSLALELLSLILLIHICKKQA